MDFPLTGENLFELTIIATLIVQFFSVVYVGLLKQGKPSKGVMRIIVFVVAVVYAFFRAEYELPSTEDPMQLAIALLQTGLVVLGFAHNAYKIILEPVLEWVDAKVLGGRTVLAP